MKFEFHDGGRHAAGFKGAARDCVTRAIAIATELPYRQVYDDLHAALDDYASTHRDRTARRISRGGGRTGTTPRNGVSSKVYRPYLEKLGWRWVPTMGIGRGCTVHLRNGELPGGRLIVQVSKHVLAIIDGVIYDTHDDQRDGTRCVYGYFFRPAG